MRVIYDQVSSEYLFPISKADLTNIRKKEIVSNAIWEKIALLRFGCNTKTDQEGRTVQRGNSYEIRINFCLRNFNTLILSDDSKYLNQISRFGGKIDFDSRCITWKKEKAQSYAFFILFHELGHIEYCEKFSGGSMEGRGSHKEEQWCNNFANMALSKF